MLVRLWTTGSTRVCLTKSPRSGTRKTNRPLVCSGFICWCVGGALWGDTKGCAVNNFQSADGNGWRREYDVKCDGSPGMSGAAHDTANTSLGTAAMGVYSQHNCTPPGCNFTWANTMTRITPNTAASKFVHDDLARRADHRAVR